MDKNVVNAARQVRSELEAEAARAPFRADLEKFYEIELGSSVPPLAARLRMWSLHLGLQCVATYRFNRWARELARRRRLLGLGPRLTALAAVHAMRILHHVEIAADIGPGFYIGHASNIFIGPTRIGRNFSVTHNVTIGIGHQPGAKGLPVLGDDVWVGTGSVLFGAITVGDRVTVGSGTVLSRNAPDQALVGGNPGRLVLRDFDNRKLFREGVETPQPDADGAPPEPSAVGG